MNLVPKLVATTGAAAVTAGLIAIAPATQQPSAPVTLPAVAAPALPISPEVELTAITDIFSWAYWISVAPWAFIPVSSLTPAPIAPDGFVAPTIGGPGDTIKSFYTSFQPWGEYAVDISAYGAGWVPVGVGLIQPELLPIVIGLVLYSLVGPVIYDFGEALVTPVVMAWADLLGAAPTPAPTEPEGEESAITAAALVNAAHATASTPAETAKAADEQTVELTQQDIKTAAPQELADSVPAAVDAAAEVVTAPVDAVKEEAPAEIVDQGADDAANADDVVAGGVRITKSIVAAPGTVAGAAVSAQGEVRGAVTEAVTDVADAVTSGDGGAVREAVAETPGKVSDGVVAGVSELAGGVKKASDDVGSAAAGGDAGAEH